MIGLLAVALFMIVYYKLSGLVANVALILNMIILLGFLAAFKATLTLPGIAGIVLIIGMSVDANVLIFERIREEIRSGKSPRERWRRLQQGVTHHFGHERQQPYRRPVSLRFWHRTGQGLCRHTQRGHHRQLVHRRLRDQDHLRLFCLEQKNIRHQRVKTKRETRERWNF